MSYFFAIIGFALILYGYSPLSGSRALDGDLTLRGLWAMLIGIAIVAVVGCVKVLA